MVEIDNDLEPSVEELASGGLSSDKASLLDQLTASRDESASNRETFISIPGYESSGSTLFARYKLLSGPELERISRRTQKTKKKGKTSVWDASLKIACDVMVAACTGIFVQTADDEEPVPLCYPWPGGPEIVGFSDPRLAQALQIEASTARELIIGVFCDNELAVSTHSVKLNRWFGNTNQEVDNDLLGEALQG